MPGTEGVEGEGEGERGKKKRKKKPPRTEFLLLVKVLPVSRTDDRG